MNDESRLSLEALRLEFDERFTRPVEVPDTNLEPLVLVTAGRFPLAMRLKELQQVVPDGVVVPLPGTPPELAGITWVLGELAPVVRLAVLLGEPPGPIGRWLVLTGGAEPVAIVCDAFEGAVTVHRDAIVPLEAAGPSRGWVAATVRLSGGARPLIDVPAILEKLRRDAHPAPAWRSIHT